MFLVISVAFMVVGGYYRIQSQRSGERLDRTKEGWPILIGVRLMANTNGAGLRGLSGRATDSSVGIF